MHFGQLFKCSRIFYRDPCKAIQLFGEALPQMKNPYEVLKAKEKEFIRIRKEMDALRIAVRLLDAEENTAHGEGQPQLTRVVEMP